MDKSKFIEQFIEELENTITERVEERIRNEIVEKLETKIFDKILKDLTLDIKEKVSEEKILTKDSVLKLMQLLIQPINIITDRLGDTIRTRVYHSILNEDIWYVWQLITKIESEIYRLPGIGKNSINELKDILKSFGLSFGTKLSKEQIEFCKSHTTTDSEDSNLIFDKFIEILEEKKLQAQERGL